MDLRPQKLPGVVVRPISDEEWPAFARCGELAFGEADHDEFLAWDRANLPLGRTLAAFDGEVLVGTSAAYDLAMTVPGGGCHRVAALTWVSVRPTHRRRGIVSTLLRGQLRGAIARKEPFAALWASESGIYRSFGYGLSGSAMRLRMPASGTALRADLPDDQALSVRLVEPIDSVPAFEAALGVERARRGGMLGADLAWGRRMLIDPASARGGASPLRAVVVEDHSGVRAAARYTVTPHWAASLPQGLVVVKEAYAADPVAGVRLWRYLLSLDLVRVVEARLRPPDDALLTWLVDPRAAQPAWRDGTFVRPVDLVASLELRRYACPVDVVLQVSDPEVSGNTGRFRLQGGPDGATCAPTPAQAHLSLSVTELGAAYLGGTSLASLGTAGLIDEHVPGALAATSTAFGWPLAPWTQSIF